MMYEAHFLRRFHSGSPFSWRKNFYDTVNILLPTNHFGWATAPAGKTLLSYQLATLEAKALKSAPPKQTGGIGGRLFGRNNIGYDLMDWFPQQWLAYCTEPRITRFTARILLDAQAGQAIPKDTAELCERYGGEAIAVQPLTTALVYTVNPDGGFTVEADIASISPMFNAQLAKPISITILGSEIQP